MALQQAWGGWVVVAMVAVAAAAVAEVVAAAAVVEAAGVVLRVIGGGHAGCGDGIGLSLASQGRRALPSAGAHPSCRLVRPVHR